MIGRLTCKFCNDSYPSFDAAHVCSSGPYAPKLKMTSFKMFGWVSDGVYDKRDFMIRYQVRDGNPTTVISKSWLDTGGPATLDASLRVPFGSYPDMPPKPRKN